MTAKVNNPKRRVADTAQIVAIHATMSAHCRAVDGFAAYDDGWNDERVLREVLSANPSWNIALPTIARTRSENFGRLRSPRRMGHDEAIEALKAQINSMQGQIGRLAASNAELQEKVSKMELHLRHRGGYVPPPGKQVSTPPSNGSLV